MADEDEEIVEMDLDEDMEDEKKKSAPPRRVPRRARSTDGGGISSPTRRSPVRTRSTDGTLPGRRTAPMRSKTSDGTSSGGNGGPLRRARTDAGSSGLVGGSATTRRQSRIGRMVEAKEEDDDDMDEGDAPAPRPRRAPPRRTKSSDGAGLAARMMPRRVRSTDGMEEGPAGGAAGGTRGTPKRTMSGFGRAPPRRAKSSDGSTGGGTLMGMRKGRKKEKAGMSANSMNIFGSDMVSSDAVLADIEKAKADQEICKLELEDFFTAERECDSIPLALKDLFECDDRPWESVVFVDDVMDGACYPEFRARKKDFQRTLGGVTTTRLIPVTYKSKVTLSSGNLSPQEMADLLQKFKTDKSVTSLVIKSDNVDEIIVTSLADLFASDKRKWETVTLQLSGGGPDQPGTPEHTAWCHRMQRATEKMQQVCKDRGIHLG